ncbi:MAG: 50S ribosomal protein L22, partial [Thermoplasmatota archaeon]
PDPETTAKAYGKELQISPKTSVEICREIKNQDVDKAVEYLEKVINGEKAVPYKKHKKQIAHNKGVGPGGYPNKAARHIKNLLEECKANAENKGLDSNNMKIITIAAHEGSPIKGFQPRAMGRSSPQNKTTTNIEVILQEKEA